MGGLRLEAPTGAPPAHPGDLVVLRETWAGRTFAERPARVIRDDAGIRMFYVAAGSPWRYASDAAGNELRLPAGDWLLGERPIPLSTLSFAFAGAWASVLASWDPATGAFVGWYVNLQTPMRRTADGYDYVDLFLDILVAPDRSSWSWKDEDELDQAIALGLLGEEELALARNAGERAVEWLLLRQPPFDDPWEDWHPDPAWGVPSLPTA